MLKNNVIEIGPHSNMTVPEALDYCSRRGLTDVVISGFDGEEDFICVTSKMSRQDVLWIAACIQNTTLNPRSE